MADDHRVPATGPQRAAGAAKVHPRPVVDWPPRTPEPARGVSRPSPRVVTDLSGLTDLTRRRPRRPESLAALLDAAPARATGFDLRLRPLIRVGDMATSLRFYGELGAEVIHGGADSDYVLLQLGVVQIGLLVREPNPLSGPGDVELTFSTPLPLSRLEERLRAAGIFVTESGDEELEIRSPDGLLIRFTQRDPDPYV